MVHLPRFAASSQIAAFGLSVSFFMLSCAAYRSDQCGALYLTTWPVARNEIIAYTHVSGEKDKGRKVGLKARRVLSGGTRRGGGGGTVYLVKPYDMYCAWQQSLSPAYLCCTTGGEKLVAGRQSCRGDTECSSYCDLYASSSALRIRPLGRQAAVGIFVTDAIG